MYEKAIMQPVLQISISIALGIAGLIILILSARWLRSGSISKRLVQFVEVPMDDTQRRANAVRMKSRIITGSFFRPTLIPACRSVGTFFGRVTARGAIEGLEQ